jgi:prepilin-type processing-associated H-X9-DG protein
MDTPFINYYIIPTWNNQKMGYGHFRLAKTLVPAETYLCSDSSGCYVGYLDYRHLNKNNFLWADGHIRLSAQNGSGWLAGNVPNPLYAWMRRPMYNGDPPLAHLDN